MRLRIYFRVPPSIPFTVPDDATEDEHRLELAREEVRKVYGDVELDFEISEEPEYALPT